MRQITDKWEVRFMQAVNAVRWFCAGYLAAVAVILVEKL